MQREFSEVSLETVADCLSLSLRNSPTRLDVDQRSTATGCMFARKFYRADIRVAKDGKRFDVGKWYNEWRPLQSLSADETGQVATNGTDATHETREAKRKKE